MRLHTQTSIIDRKNRLASYLVVGLLLFVEKCLQREPGLLLLLELSHQHRAHCLVQRFFVAALWTSFRGNEQREPESARWAVGMLYICRQLSLAWFRVAQRLPAKVFTLVSMVIRKLRVIEISRNHGQIKAISSGFH